MKESSERILILALLTGCGGHVNAVADASAEPDCGAMTTCSNQCVVLSDDARHCGSCDHDCGGGGCIEGHCQPEVELAFGALRLAINAHDVVWTNGDANASGGAVSRCAKWGCGGKPTVVASDAGTANGPLAVSATTAYWSSASTLVTCALDACSTPRAFGGLVDQYIATDGTRVYWNGESGLLYACPVSGCAADPHMDTHVSGATLALALNSTDVFWAVRASGGPGIWIGSCPLAGCETSPRIFIRDALGVDALAADGVNVYWAGPTFDDVSHSSILTCPLSGCPNEVATVLASRQVRPTSLVTDGSNVYWGSEGSGADSGAPAAAGVMRCAVGGCGGAPSVIAASPGGATSVVVDEKSVYWIKLPQGPGHSSIMKTAK